MCPLGQSPRQVLAGGGSRVGVDFNLFNQCPKGVITHSPPSRCTYTARSNVGSINRGCYRPQVAASTSAA